MLSTRTAQAVSSSHSASDHHPDVGKSSSSDNVLLEDEDFSSSAHRATLLLCQMLTFLSIAAFFFQTHQSLIDGSLWASMIRANGTVAGNSILGQLFQNVFQVIFTLPITYFLSEVFKRLDASRSARMLFETRVAANTSKFIISGISQENAVDLRRSIYEVEGLLRIVKEASSNKAEDTKVVELHLRLLRSQLLRVRRERAKIDEKEMEAKIDACKVAGKYSYGEFKKIRGQHIESRKKAREVEDILVKLSALRPVQQAVSVFVFFWGIHWRTYSLTSEYYFLRFVCSCF